MNLLGDVHADSTPSHALIRRKTQPGHCTLGPSDPSYRPEDSKTMSNRTNRPALAAAGGAPAPAQGNLWILGPTRDLMLFVATPLLILPAMWLAQQRFRIEDIALFVASFGALGHHMPGMIRAYGDRALFERFKVRFIVAPIFLATVCLLFTVHDLSGIVLAVYLWGVWHGLMQTYGFLRIYDSKVKSFAPLTSRLDHYMCLAWFLSAVVLSPTRSHNVLNTFYKAGGPILPTGTFQILQQLTLGALVAVNIAFLVNLVVQWRRGTPPSPIKLLLMVTSFGFWWYSNVLVANMLVGIALFEIFHDVQYLSIVWLYNRKRADQAQDQLSGFARFLFRRSGALVGLYVGLVFAYGSLNYVAQGVALETLQRVLMGLLLASALLHFYYDGFIWKVREKSTRKSLGLEGGTQERRVGWLLHGGRWALFVLPLTWLGVMETRGTTPEMERTRAVAEAMPEYGLAQFNLGVVLADAGDTEGARERYERAVELNPGMADAHFNLGNLLLAQGDAAGAVEHLERAALLEPEDAQARGNLGSALLEAGRTKEAVDVFEEALDLDPQRTELRSNLGNALLTMGRTEEAAEQYRQALKTNSEDPRAHYNLSRVLAGQGNEALALEHLREAVRLDPSFADAHFNLANALSRQGDLLNARRHYESAVALMPEAETYLNLGNTLERLRLPGEATQAYQRALALEPNFAPAHYALGVVAYGRGDLDEAVQRFREALRLRPDFADARHNLGVALVRSGQREEGERLLAQAERQIP